MQSLKPTGMSEVCQLWQDCDLPLHHMVTLRKEGMAPAELFGFQVLCLQHQGALLGLAEIGSGQHDGHGAAPGVAEG